MRRLFSMLAVTLMLASACDPVGPVDEGERQENLLPTEAPSILLPTEAPSLSSSRGRTDEELTFVRYAEGERPADLEASFVVVAGVANTLVVHYANRPTEAPLLEFEVGAGSLLLHPDGRPVLPGELVEIRVRLDPTTFKYHFAPAGLVFSPADPARLRLNYEHADPDLNGDSLIDLLDAVLEHRLRIWQQDREGLPWIRLPTHRLPGLDIIEGRVTHFTGFAMSS